MSAPLLLFIAGVSGPPPSFHPDRSQPLEPPVIAGKCKNPTGFNPKFTELVRTPPATHSVDPGLLSQPLETY
ncbi:unnamed protein product [Prunus armeniaca]